MSDVLIRELRSIDCRLAQRDWPFAVENRQRIEAHWTGLVARKPALFNGRVLIMYDHRIEADVFRGAYLATDYASFIAFRDFGFPDPSMRNCFSMAALQSAEGDFILGEMGPQTANAGAIYFAAGTPDLKDVVRDTVDLGGSVLRELAEETGLGRDLVTVEPGWTAVFCGARIALMRRVRSSLGTAALLERIEAFLASETEPELARMHAVRSIDEMPAERMPEFQIAYLRHALGAAQRTG